MKSLSIVASVIFRPLILQGTLTQANSTILFYSKSIITVKMIFFYLCGDFSSRCGDLEDFIAGVDSIPDRNVIDYTINKEGERFCEFSLTPIVV